MILTFHGRPLNLNAERKMSPHRRAREKRKIRERALVVWLEAERLPGPPWQVVVSPRYKTNAHRPDVGACFPSVKSIIDAAVDAGLLADDGPDHITNLTFGAPVMGTGESDRLVLVVL